MHAANVVKDLGVLMDNSFSPSIHCKEAAFKARWMLLMIKRSFTKLSVSAFAPLYNTLATRLVQGFRRLPYEERLRRLGLHSLGRRLRGDLIVVCIFFRRIGSGPQSFSIRVVKYWNRLPTPIVTAPSVIRRGKNCLV